MNESPYVDRRSAVLRLMQQQGLDALVVGPSAAFKYFTGKKAILTERFVGLLISRDRQLIITPRLQAPLYDGIPGLQLCVWDEAQDPMEVLARQIREITATRVAFNDEFWSGFLLRLQSQQDKLRVTSGGALLSELRLVKSDQEMARMASASAQIDRVWQAFCESTPSMAGQTELQLRARIDGLMRDFGFTEISWVDVGAGSNGASPLHHGSDYVIRQGDPVVFDYAGCYGDYFGDICRVAITGETPREYKKVYELVKHAQQTAFQAIKPGVEAQEIDAIARRIITAAGHGEHFTHRLGHGIGLAAHEDPYIVEGNKCALKQGMVFSNEPGVYVPGKWGVRIEDIVAVTETGGLRLNHVSRDIAQLG